MSDELITLRIASEAETGIRIVDVNDDLSGHMAAEFRAALGRLLDEGSQKLLINLSRARHVNSTAIGTLVATAKQLHQCGGDLKIYGLADHVKRIFDLVGASTVIEIYESEKRALSSFEGS